MGINDNKSEQGFLQVDNQILDLLLCDTQLNVYGVLMLSKIREYQRKKMQCFVSNATFAKLYKTSESMIKRQINELYNLGLIESTVSLNSDGVIGKTRLLRTPRNYTKILNKILTTKQSLDIIIKGQNSTFTPKMNLDNLEKNKKIKGQNEGVTPDFEPRKSDTIKGHFIGSNHPISLGHSDPITIDINNSLINNKLLEGDTGDFPSPFTSPSPTSSTDDYWNATDSENVGIPDVIDDANFDAILGDNNLDINLESDIDMENPNRPTPYPNQKNDEMTEWYFTQLNPISRYQYEVKWKTQNTAMRFAWGERLRPDNQKDYYTIEHILEYFTLENQLPYLEKIGWIDKHRDYLERINWEHLWMFSKKI